MNTKLAASLLVAGAIGAAAVTAVVLDKPTVCRRLIPKGRDLPPVDTIVTSPPGLVFPAYMQVGNGCVKAACGVPVDGGCVVAP